MTGTNAAGVVNFGISSAFAEAVRDAQVRRVADAKTIGVSGSREGDIMAHYGLVYAALAETVRAGAFTRLANGGCKGIDDIAGQAGHGLGLLVHTILVPNWEKIEWTADWWEYTDTTATMSHGTGFKERDQAVVDTSEALLAFPLYAERHSQSRRSGTWMTIRLAREKGIPVEVIVLRP